MPQLLALRLCPAIGTLIDRDDELPRPLQKFEQVGLDCLHAITPSASISMSSCSTSTSPETSFGSSRSRVRVRLVIPERRLAIWFQMGDRNRLKTSTVLRSGTTMT